MTKPWRSSRRDGTGEARLLDGLTSEDPEYATKLSAGVQAEIDKDAPLRSRQFEDSVLKRR